MDDRTDLYAVFGFCLYKEEINSALDPASSRAIEKMMLRMKENYTIVFVTHNIPQARRISDELIFMCEGKIIEAGSKEQLFNHPRSEATRKYLQENICDC